MTPGRPFRNVALIGFMGVGKSTIGALVASLLDFTLVDTDKVIEERTGRRVAEIFASEGEAAFRALEAGLVQELESAQGKVIATGGGLPMFPGNFESLQRHAYVTCLWASVDTIYQRVRYQSHRPLLHTADPTARIRELLTERSPIYRKADLLVGVDFRAPAESARLIVSAYRQVTTVRPVFHAVS